MRIDDVVSGWMTDAVTTIAPDRSLMDAYVVMFKARGRHLPVVDGDRLVGMLSDRDLYRWGPLKDAAHPEGAMALCTTAVAEIMTREPIHSVDPLTTIGDAAEILLEAKIGALPVLDGGRLVGIITTRDLLGALVKCKRGGVKDAAGQ